MLHHRGVHPLVGVAAVAGVPTVDDQLADGRGVPHPVAHPAQVGQVVRLHEILYQVAAAAAQQNVGVVEAYLTLQQVGVAGEEALQRAVRQLTAAGLLLAVDACDRCLVVKRTEGVRAVK